MLNKNLKVLYIEYNLLKNLTIVSDFYRNLNQEQNTACLAIINDSFNLMEFLMAAMLLAAMNM